MKDFSKYIAVIALCAASQAVAQEVEQPLVDNGAAPDSTLIEVALGEVVPEWSYTGSISTITSEELEYWQGRSLDEALLGKLAGYYNNGNIRGRSSVNDNAQLVVLDGVPAPNLDLSTLDPKSIASVSILKDAAAKALYGPLGAQGVILIESKHGHNGPTKVNASANFGWEQPSSLPDMIGSYDYAVMRNQALVNDGLEPLYSDSQVADFASGKGFNNNWRKKYMRDFRPAQSYNVGISGGNEKTKFFVNAGYDHIGSLYKAEFKDKFNPEEYTQNFNIATNIQVQMYKFLKMFTGTTVRIGHHNYTRGYESDKYIDAFYTTPATVTDEIVDGHVMVDENFPNSIYGQLNYKGVHKVTSTKINAHFGLDLDLGFLTKGLSAKGIFGYNSYYEGDREGSYDYARWIYNSDGEFQRLGTNNDDPLSWKKGSKMQYFMNIQATVKYERTFGDHYVDAFVNYLAEDRLGKKTETGWLLPYNRIQLAGHVKYGYGKRYFVQFDFTQAGSEMMREGYQFHFSPTGSLAWVASNESFLKNAKWLNLLKFRASFGALEYDVLQYMASRYLYASEFRQASGGAIGNIYTYSQIAEGVIGNPNIKWEKSYQQDYGFDLSVLNNSLNVNFDYWRTNQRQMVVQGQTVPYISGIASTSMPFENIGKAFAEGVDVQVNYTKQLPAGIGLTVGADFGWNHNKVIDAADLDYSGLNYAYDYRKSGYAIGQKFGYLVDYSNGNGFYNSQAEIDKANLKYQGTQPRVGDLRYVDLNGDGSITDADKAPLNGVKDTPNINYGASVKLTWNNFDLYVFMQGESGRSILASGLGYWENEGTQGAYFNQHLQAWTAERYAAGEPISYPALSTTQSFSLQDNDFFVQKLNFFRLKNVTLGYSLPKKWMKAIRMEQIRFYFTGQNLACANNLKFKGMDPESSNLHDLVMRSYNFGVNIKF